MKNRLEFKLELLRMEGLGMNRSEVVEQLAEKFGVSKKIGYYYFKTRASWQPEILGLDDAKDAYHQTLNRLDHIYRHFSLIAQTAPEYSNRVGALKGMLETISRKAELTGVLTPSTIPIIEADEELDQEVFKSLTEEERAVIGRATQLFLEKRQTVEEQHAKGRTVGEMYAKTE